MNALLIDFLQEWPRGLCFNGVWSKKEIYQTQDPWWNGHWINLNMQHSPLSAPWIPSRVDMGALQVLLLLLLFFKQCFADQMPVKTPEDPVKILFKRWRANPDVSRFYRLVKWLSGLTAGLAIIRLWVRIPQLTAGFTMTWLLSSTYWITISWFAQLIIIDLKPIVWERLAVASLVFISLCGSLPSSLDGKIIQNKTKVCVCVSIIIKLWS